MKKILLSLLIILISGCSLNMNPTPKQTVENYLNKYKSEHNDVISQLKETIDAAFDKDEYKERYKTLILNQYKKLEYKVTDEITESDSAVVEVEVKVLDYGTASKKADDYLLEHKEEFLDENKKLDNDKFQDYKLSLMEKVKDITTYTIEFNLTKDDKGKWEIDNLSDNDLEKLHGIYID